VFRDYLTALEKKKGKAGPSVSSRCALELEHLSERLAMSQFQQLRVVHPIAVNRTVRAHYNFRLNGRAEQMFRNTISFANIVNGTGSLVLTDDLEIYNRIDMGCRAGAPNGCRSARLPERLPTRRRRKRHQFQSEVYIRKHAPTPGRAT